MAMVITIYDVLSSFFQTVQTDNISTYVKIHLLLPYSVQPGQLLKLCMPTMEELNLIQLDALAGEVLSASNI